MNEKTIDFDSSLNMKSLCVWFVSSIHQIQEFLKEKEKQKNGQTVSMFFTQDQCILELFDTRPRSHSSDIPTLSYNLVPPHYNPPVPFQ